MTNGVAMARVLPALLAASISLCLYSAQAQQPAQPAAPAAEITDPLQRTIAGIKRLLVQRPTDPTLHFYLASFQARAKEPENALASLRTMHELGDGFLPGTHFGFENLKDNPEFIALRAEIERKLPVLDKGALAFRIEDRMFGPEGIAYDAQTRNFFIGSITHKQLARFNAAGKMSPFAGSDTGLQQVLGVAVDAKRRLVYAVSTNALSNGKPLHNAVFAFDIKSGAKRAEYPVPDAVQLNDIAVAPNGELFVSDSASGAIYRIAAGQKDAPVSVFMPAGTVGGSNGLALSANGKTLYVGHSTGMVRVDTASGKFDKLMPPARETIAGVDGLYVHKGDLIGIQNLINPGRVIRIRLSADGTIVDKVDTIQSHHNKHFLEPTTGAIAGNAIHVLTSNLPRFNDKGEIDNLDAMKHPTVVKVPLGKP